MNSDILLNLSQLIILAVSALVVMLVAAFRREHGLVSGLTLAGLFLALFVFLIVPPIMPLEMTSLLIMDGYTLFFSSLIIFSAISSCGPFLKTPDRPHKRAITSWGFLLQISAASLLQTSHSYRKD